MQYWGPGWITLWVHAIWIYNSLHFHNVRGNKMAHCQWEGLRVCNSLVLAFSYLVLLKCMVCILYFDVRYWKYSFRSKSLLLDYKDVTPDKNLHPLTAALMVKHNKEMGVSEEVCTEQNVSRFYLFSWSMNQWLKLLAAAHRRGIIFGPLTFTAHKIWWIWKVPLWVLLDLYTI